MINNLKQLHYVEEMNKSFSNDPNRGLLCLSIHNYKEGVNPLKFIDGYITSWIVYEDKIRGDSIKVSFKTYDDIIEFSKLSIKYDYNVTLYTHRMSESQIKNIVISHFAWSTTEHENGLLHEAEIQFMEGIWEGV